jgi:hypothetical protein
MGRRRVLTVNGGWDGNGGWAGIDVAKCRGEGLKGVGTGATQMTQVLSELIPMPNEDRMQTRT